MLWQIKNYFWQENKLIKCEITSMFGSVLWHCKYENLTRDFVVLYIHYNMIKPHASWPARIERHNLTIDYCISIIHYYYYYYYLMKVHVSRRLFKYRILALPNCLFSLCVSFQTLLMRCYLGLFPYAQSILILSNWFVTILVV